MKRCYKFLKKLIELVNNKTVIDVLESKNHLNLAKFIGRQLCDFTENDEKYIDLFWDSAFNQSWIYLSDEIVIEWMGYKMTKSAISNFTKEMKNKYTNDVDYKEVNRTHKLVEEYHKTHPLIHRDGNRKKYYIITGETLKKMLLRASTKQGDITCDYFIKVESLGNITTKLIFKYAEQEKQKQLDDALEHNNCLHNINAELLTYKKLSTRDESIYIVSTLKYAQQGLFKIGRTKNIKSRNSDHNVAHVNGDKVKVLAEFKVNNATLMEAAIHKKLGGLRPDKNSEFFMCPYDLLYNITDMLVNFDYEGNETINKIIETVYKIKQHKFISSDWTSGIAMDIFNEHIRLVVGDGAEVKELAKFDMTAATEEQKQAFVRECIAGYQRTIAPPADQVKNAATTIIWKAFQGFLIQRLSGPKSHFKAMTWKKYMQAEEVTNKQLAITWRGSI